MDPDLIAEGILSKVVDKIKGRKQIGTTGSGGKIYVSTRNKPSKVVYGGGKYKEKTKQQEQPAKKTSGIDHDDPWLKSSSGAEKKAHYRQLRGESTTIEDLNGNSFVEIVDVKIEEATRIQAKTGNLMMVIAMWRGRSYSLKMFFPQAKLPSKKEVEEQIQKIYPGSKVIYSKVCEREPGEPFLQVEDWQKVNKSDKTDGMSPAAVKAYRRENPGSKLKTAVTGDPEPGSKDAKRRKSFCSRSKGQQDMHNIDCSKDPDKAICKARRRWKC